MSLESEIIQFFKAVALKKKDRESSRLLVSGREEREYSRARRPDRKILLFEYELPMTALLNFC